MDIVRNINGRVASQCATRLLKSIAAGKPAPGAFLPPERELATRYGVARKTLRIALQQLTSQGVLAAVPRHGYRVLRKGLPSLHSQPVAFMCDRPADDAMTSRYKTQLAEFQAAAERRGWPFLVTSFHDKTRAAMVAQLSASKAAGAVLDTSDLDLVRMVVATGIPAVMVDDWHEEVDADSVMQDGHQGMLLAVEYLIARGHRRIAWLGSPVTEAHSKDRFGGFAAGMAAAGLPLDTASCLFIHEPGELAGIRARLTGPTRPTGIVAPWVDPAVAAAQAAADLKLRLGPDLEIVGWSMAETYDTDYRARFHGAQAPATVTWSVRVMAEAAMARLAERRLHPTTARLRIRIPMSLKPAS